MLAATGKTPLSPGEHGDVCMPSAACFVGHSTREANRDGAAGALKPRFPPLPHAHAVLVSQLSSPALVARGSQRQTARWRCSACRDRHPTGTIAAVLGASVDPQACHGSSRRGRPGRCVANMAVRPMIGRPIVPSRCTRATVAQALKMNRPPAALSHLASCGVCPTSRSTVRTCMLHLAHLRQHAPDPASREPHGRRYSFIPSLGSSRRGLVPVSVVEPQAGTFLPCHRPKL